MTDQIEIRFEIPEADASPKDMRALLLGQMLTWLDNEIENTGPDHVAEEHHPDRTPSPYWRALMRVDALRPVRSAVRSMLRTVEEYLIFDRENSKTPAPTEAELECARHRDRCTVCVDHGMVTHRRQRERDRLEQVRVILVEGIGDILIAIEVDKAKARAGDEPVATVPAIAKQLRRIQEAAQKRWLRREKAS